MKTHLALVASSALCLLSAVAPGQEPDRDERSLAGAVRDALQQDPRGSAEARRLERQRLLDLQLAQLVNQRLAEVGGLSGLVVACHEGQVELRGQAARDESRQRATELALTVRGVASVTNALRVPGEPEPEPQPAGEIFAQPPVPPAPGSATEPFGFVTGDGLAGRDVRVEAADGLVRLRGEVNSDGARAYASTTALSVAGVRAVRNELVIRAATQDESRRLAVLIQRQFDYDPLVQAVAPMLLVRVRDGVVRLEGRVRDAGQRQRAEELAAAQVGVFAVDDRLEIDEDLQLQTTRRGPVAVLRWR